LLPLPSTKTTLGSAQAPRTTSASIPTRFAAIAKCDEASASQSLPVSGLSATTANFAEVVSGLPTSGLSDQRAEREAERRVGRQRIGPRRSFVRDDPGPQSDTTDKIAQDGLLERDELGPSRSRVDPEIAAMPAGQHVTSPSHVSGHDEEHVAVGQGRCRVGDELLAVETRAIGGVEGFPGDHRSIECRAKAAQTPERRSQ
jgi:hypothetical protein